MAMTAEKVQSVCESMERIIRASPNEHGYPCDNLQPSPLSQSELATLIFTIEEDDKVSQHLLYMLQETAKLVKEDRDKNFIAKNNDGLTVNRWVSTGFLAASATTNETAYLTYKVVRSLGIVAFDNQARV